jgi:hypothetical protein
MSSWNHLIRFRADDNKIYFASLDSADRVLQIEGQSVTGHATFDDFLRGKLAVSTTVKQVRHATSVDVS